MQERNFIVAIHRFLCSLMCGDCMPQFHVHVHVCVSKISIYNRWELEEFKTTCKLFGNLQSLPCIFCTNQTKKTPLHLNVSRSKQKKHFTLKYAFLIQIGLIIFLFLPFKLFISSWSLWLKQFNTSWRVEPVENSKACRHTKYGNWIQSKRGIKYKCWKSKAGYFIHCMTGRKVKFTWNDQNTNCFLENLIT